MKRPVLSTLALLGVLSLCPPSFAAEEGTIRGLESAVDQTPVALQGGGNAVPLVIGEAVQIPKTVYVGDSLTLLVQCPAPAGLPQSPSPSDLLLPSDQLAPLTFDTVELLREGDTVHISLSLRAWKPGLIALGDLHLAGSLLSGLSVRVSSVLDTADTDRSPAGPLGGLLPPGTKLLIAVFVGIVPLLLLLLAILKKIVVPALLRAARRRPRRRLLARMKRLISPRKPLPPAEVLLRHAGLLREWLSLLSGRNLDACTPAELKHLEARDALLFAPALRLPHEALLAFHDASRFSGRSTDWTAIGALIAASLAACEAADALLLERERGRAS